MKRRTTILALVLSMVLCFGLFQAAFAGFGITGTAPDGNELAIETAAMKLHTDAVESGYNLVDTATLGSWVKDGKKMLVIDTMPAGSFAAHRVKGAINVECGDDGPNGAFTAAQKAALLKAVKDYSGTKKVKYYWSKKSKKWVTTKPSKLTKCTKKSDKNYGKKYKYVTKAVKNKTIVVYCGFVKCRRSHAAADYLVKKGYTKVYRHPGGISAWGDAELPIEGTDAE